MHCHTCPTFVTGRVWHQGSYIPATGLVEYGKGFVPIGWVCPNRIRPFAILTFFSMFLLNFHTWCMLISIQSFCILSLHKAQGQTFTLFEKLFTFKFYHPLPSISKAKRKIKKSTRCTSLRLNLVYLALEILGIQLPVIKLAVTQGHHKPKVHPTQLKLHTIKESCFSITNLHYL